MNKYINNINDKIKFLIDNKKTKDAANTNIIKEEIKIENIEKTISFLIDYLSDDMITKKLIQQSMEELNENLINKEKSLNYLNKLLFISNKTQDIKDLISSIHCIIKNDKNSFSDFDMELLGADKSLIAKYKKQVFLYILQLINRLKKQDNNSYDISYYFTLINSLFCPFTEKDYNFIEISQLYDIFNYNNKNKYNNLLLYHNSNNFTRINYDEANIFRISYDSLYKESFNLFKLMTFLAIKLSNANISNPFIKYIFDIIIKIFTNYIDEMNDFKNGKKNNNEITNEEKLNSYLILFYRCILKKNITDIIKKYYNNIISILFHILTYSSPKNKIISLKIIEILFINDKLDESFMKKNIEIFKKDLQENNIKLYNFIYTNKVKHIDNIFVEYLFNLSLLFQQNIDNIVKYINGTENNIAISLIIIKMIQNKLLKKDNSPISQDFMKFIENNVFEPKFLSVILQILGVDIYYKHIGSYIEVEKDKKGIILAFSNNILINEDSSNYCKGDYIYFIREDNIYRYFLTNLDLSIESMASNNIKIIANNLPILPLEKNKLIYEYFSENLTKYEEKDIYLILRYIKILVIEENIKLNDKIISYIMTQSLNKEILQFKCKIISLENLENMMIPYLCESNPLIFLEGEEKNKDKNEEKDEKSEDGEKLELPPFSPDIYLDDTSLYYRCGEELSLGINLPYKKIFNYGLFTKSKSFLKIFDNIIDAKRYKENCIVMTKELLTLEKVPTNIKYIIIPDSFNEEDFPKNKINTIPIIMIDSLTYLNIYQNTFKQEPFEDINNLFIESISRDVSTLIDLPFELVAEFTEKPRDTLLDILNEELNNDLKDNNKEEDNKDEENQNYAPYFEEFKNVLCGQNINKIDKKQIFNKLISLICGR